MSEKMLGNVALLIGLGFAAFFAVYVLPAAISSGDIIAALLAGFVNPFAAGYSTDTILCGVILAVWIIYEQMHDGPRRGWVCLPLIVIPGVATAFGLYLFMRSRHVPTRSA